MDIIMSNILNFPAPVKFVYGGRNFGDFVDTPISDASYMYLKTNTKIIRISADLSLCTNMSHMFDSSEVKFVEGLITTSCTDMSYMFHKCFSLLSLQQLDCGNVNDMSNFFSSDNLSIPLSKFGGFKDLGKQPEVKGLSYWGFLDTAHLTHESLMNIINNLYDRRSNGLPTLSIRFGPTHLDKLTNDEISIAINKGWTLIG